MTVLILDNYDSFTYNLYQMVQAQTDDPVLVRRNDAVDFDDLRAMAPRAIILSPGPGHPARPADFGICRDIILRQPELHCPVLGVCLGHQGVVHYLGGRIIPAPAVVHGKTSMVRIVRDSPLLAGLPNPFTVMRYHSWMAEAASLPAGLSVIAETIPPDGEAPLVMAVQHHRLPLYGVQFHPESIGTPDGARLLGNFLTLQPAGLRA